MPCLLEGFAACSGEPARYIATGNCCSDIRAISLAVSGLSIKANIGCVAQPWLAIAHHDRNILRPDSNKSLGARDAEPRT
ncbi:MAG: hypothetical protein QOD90_3295 [Mycobacterium sp.]|nr:hypothetical protein [Mycobacterium sp.]